MQAELGTKHASTYFHWKGNHEENPSEVSAGGTQTCVLSDPR